MYSIVWKYKIRKRNQAEFEFEYGTHGTWSRLFHKSSHYSGSFLHKSADSDLIYLLIDSWHDEQFYKDFISANKKDYESLSSKFEGLYEKEEKLACSTL